MAPPKRCAHLSLILVDDGIETEGVADAVVEAGRHTRKASPNVIVVAGGAGESVEVTKRRLTIPQVQNLTRQVFEAEGGDGPMACAGESA